MAQRHIVTNLTPYEQFTVERAGATLLQRVASGGGTISFPATTGATFNIDQQTTFTTPADFHTKYAALMAPVPGETILAPGELRLSASGGDFNNLGGTTADAIQWFNGDTALSVSDSHQYRTIFRARVTGLIAGTYRIWCRVTYSDGTFTDSKPHVVTVAAAPTYGSTITLTGNTAWNSATLGSGTLTGSSGSKIKIDAAGFVINGSASANLSWTHVDVFNLGATSGSTLTKGMDITVTGNLSWNTVRFYTCGALEATVNNGTAQTVGVTGCLIASNSRTPVGQNPDDSPAGSVTADTLPALIIDGTASGAKTFTANNIGASMVILATAGWTIGGSNAADENIFMGPRAGLFLTANHSTSSFTGTVKRNLIYNIYYGEWSQSSALELMGISTANGTIEHNVIAGSSWPVRGIGCEFRYNLVLADYWHHEGNWCASGLSANIHHNVFRMSDVASGRANLWNLNSASPTIRNNTFDCVNNTGGGPAFVSPGGTPVLNSNIFYRSDGTAVTISGGGVTADYNCFNSNDTDGYSNQGLQANDTTASPSFNAVPSVNIPFDLSAVWNRTKTAAQILTDYRGYYQPTNSAMDAGDTGTYGANNPIGAIARSGVSNSNDLFGTL